MKIATWNIQGLGQPGKWTRLWRWIVRHQLDLVAVQEHKKHDNEGMLVYTKDFQLRYNGRTNGYSGCLFIMRKKINFTVLFDDPKGRFIIVHLMLHGTSFVCINVYAPNSPAERLKTWKEMIVAIQYCMQLQIWEEARILLCGDFNMVESETDCTTSSSVMSSQESASWNEILIMLNCKDLWGCIGGHTLRYMFHSRSHRTAMSRLDRCYYSHVYTLKAISKMWIDATMLLSDHNPLLISLEEMDWNSCIPRNLPRIPLRINHSWMHTSLFKSKVHDLIQLVLSLKVSACMKWEYFVENLQVVIRDCGKYFSKVLNSAKCEAKQIIFTMTEKVDAGIMLSDNEYAHLCKAYKCLEFMENQAIQSSKVKARCMEVNDLHANSKCFFDFLRIKRLKDTISQLHMHGSVLTDGNSMAATCSEHFRKLFAASYRSDEAWFDSLHESLRYTPQNVDSHMAASCEKSISEHERICFGFLAFTQGSCSSGL
ncbi:hypothetical protein KP509_11G042000 [Ceratopteris richardii]|uniref:Endonuclease/exonuclease/phosphatase domain-containing protein n=1 Tax=Ceratopteris richardii TaxID=49495 RepID=A0A8T2TTX4_CERRI|nr:hypothetical protein KP509_11G042000 [Ceratopteris richardii]